MIAPPHPIAMKSLAIVIDCIVTAASAGPMLKRDQVKTVTKTYLLCLVKGIDQVHQYSKTLTSGHDHLRERRSYRNHSICHYTGQAKPTVGKNPSD